MEIIALIITFGLIGAISRGAVLFVQWYRSQSGDSLERVSSNPKLKQVLERLNLAVQALWVFIAILTAAEFESSILNLHAFIICASVGSPVIVYSGMRWVLDLNNWSWWAFIMGLCLTFLGGLSLGNYMHSEQFIGTMAGMISIFCLFSIIGYFPPLLAYAGRRKSSKK